MAALRCLYAAAAVTAVSHSLTPKSSSSIRRKLQAGSSTFPRNSLFSDLKIPLSVNHCEQAPGIRAQSMDSIGNSLEVQAPTKIDELPELMTEFMVDMSCDHCVKSVKNRLEPLEGVKQVDVDLANQVVRVRATTPLTGLTTALEQTGRKSRLIGQGSPEKFALAAAVAEFKGPVVHGVVRFAQVSQEMVRVEAQFDGLSPGEHVWSVNQYGDLTRGVESTGDRYGPDGTSETDDARDLGVLSANDAGHADYSKTNTRLKVWDLIGRAVAVYEGGNWSGAKGLSAAVIARSAGAGENYKKVCLCDGTVIWEATNSDYVKQP